MYFHEKTETFGHMRLNQLFGLIEANFIFQKPNQLKKNEEHDLSFNFLFIFSGFPGNQTYAK